MTDFLIGPGTPIVWADIGNDFGDSPIAGTVQITLASLANGAAQQGVKVDLGATRAAAYAVTFRPELDVAPASGAIISVHWAPSPSGTAGIANPGGVSGADAAYTGTTSDSLADSINQLTQVGILYCTSDAAIVVQQQTWVFSPEERYGSPVIYNTSGQAFEGDDIEMSLIFTPLVDQDV